MAEPLLVALGLSKVYPSRGGRPRVTALKRVDLAVGEAESVGVVGESGAGKSTLLRLLLALERPTTGTVRFMGRPISELPQRLVRPLRRHFQPVFQDPTASLNERQRVAAVIAEPLVAHRIGTAAEQRRAVGTLLEEVGLPATAADKRPGAFSTGERQRIALARALASEPRLLLLDEPLASLDYCVQAEILALIRRLRDRRQLAVVMVSHDLQLVATLCERVMVLFAGAVVEEGPTERVLGHPAHPYTAELLAAAPQPDPQWRPPPAPPLSATMPTTGCAFRTRCPLAHGRCQTEPALNELASNHRAACWALRG